MPKLIGFALACATISGFTAAMIYDVYFKGSPSARRVESDGSGSA